jgi:hypothetical protein
MARHIRVTLAVSAVAAGALLPTPRPAWAGPADDPVPFPTVPSDQSGAHWEVGCPEPLTELIDRSCFATYPWTGTASLTLVGEGTPSSGLPMRNVLAVTTGVKVSIAMTVRDYKGEDRSVQVEPSSTRGLSGELIVDVKQDRVVP